MNEREKLIKNNLKSDLKSIAGSYLKLQRQNTIKAPQK